MFGFMQHPQYNDCRRCKYLHHQHPWFWPSSRKLFRPRHRSHRSYNHWKSTLRWRHNMRGSVSNHQPHDCLLNRLFRRRSKKTSKLRVIINTSLLWKTNNRKWSPYFSGSRWLFWITSCDLWGSVISSPECISCVHFNTLRPRQHGRHFQTKFWNGSFWMKICEFRFQFHWNLILEVQLTIFQH